ncbi:MAG: biotin--[acetyl-CoA-carboxylase] ligase [Thermoplasmata archaeon]|nr:biotin--[acetyl-CoA-carboxylase] ligase [Thermoplasmata archaeon]
MGTRHSFEAIDSTQARAIALAHAGAEPGTRVVADRQQCGVGRADHTWSSPLGGLYLSVILPRPPPEREGLVSLAIGAELRSSLDSEFGVATMLRWPNDLMVIAGHRASKLAGILVDRVYSVEHGPALVAGIGLNVRPSRSAFPPGVREQVAILSELSPPGPSVRGAEELCVTAAFSAVDQLETEAGARSVLSECRRALFGRGRKAFVDGTVAGRIRDLGDDGTLLLDGAAGSFAVRTGSVTVEERS